MNTEKAEIKKDKKYATIYHTAHIAHIDVLRLVGYVIYVHYVVNRYSK